MMWNDFPASGFMDQMGAGTVGFVLLMILVASAVSLVVTGVMTRHASRPGPTAQPPGAQELLDQRFASGEIDEDEYWRRTAVLEQRGGSRSLS